MVGVHGFRKLPGLPIPNGIVLCMSTSDAAGRDDKQLALAVHAARQAAASGAAKDGARVRRKHSGPCPWSQRFTPCCRLAGRLKKSDTLRGAAVGLCAVSVKPTAGVCDRRRRV